MTGTLVCAKPTRSNPDGRTGTRAGYLAHYYINEPACTACIAGHARDQAQSRVDDPVRVLRGNLYSNFRLSLERYLEILESQDNRCAICLTAAPRDIRTNRFHVDHDHACCPGRKSCGQCIRGLLCHACNTALGNFGDDIERLRRASEYLAKHREPRHG